MGIVKKRHSLQFLKYNIKLYQKFKREKITNSIDNSNAIIKATMIFFLILHDRKYKYGNTNYDCEFKILKENYSFEKCFHMIEQFKEVDLG